MKKEENKYACPCCGSASLSSVGEFEICQICGWEDDPVQSRNPDFAGGANTESLDEARRNWQRRQNCKGAPPRKLWDWLIRIKRSAAKILGNRR